MAGIVNSTKKRLLINKKIKEVEVPTAVLNTAQFLADLNTVGGNANQSLILSELGALPTIIKNECVTALVCGAYKEGKLYGYNGDTKSIEEFNFERNSSATRTNAAGEIELIDTNLPRIDYDPVNGQLNGYFLEGANTNYFKDSGFLTGLANHPSRGGVTAIDTGWSKGSLLDKGIKFVKLQSDTVYIYMNVTGLPINSDVTISFYAKLDDSSIPNANDIRVTITRVTNNSWIATPVGNGVYRISLSVIAPSNGAIELGILKYSSQSEKSFVVTGVQVENGTNMSSYIPTTAASVTRLSDKITSIRDIVGFREASLYTQGSFQSGSDTRYFIYKNIPNGRFLFATTNLRSSDGASTLTFTKIESDYTKTSKIGVSYSKDKLLFALNGLAKEIESISPAPSADILSLGGGESAHVRSLAIIPRRLSVAELVTVTT